MLYRKRSLISATGHKLEGEIAIVKELAIEDEALTIRNFYLLTSVKKLRKS